MPYSHLSSACSCLWWKKGKLSSTEDQEQPNVDIAGEGNNGEDDNGNGEGECLEHKDFECGTEQCIKTIFQNLRTSSTFLT